ncbi:DUF6231 family protein [Pseudomonas sp. N040]|uniref:DUF6231 family protein n=1 Tax=Pseudomonas sp. N040 TaxID=2785325 RepID=UPI0018A2D9E4|nr:DUF6231 family protein [Pseudomonas sp. N040]MBF7730585.1 hypothetical protein [Pseudomonas sp. N040]MBW7014229.1 hypothetical protein [Pseudomonas sp. N040]
MIASISTRTPQQALAALLERQKPVRLLLVGDSELPAIKAFITKHPESQLCHAPAAALPIAVTSLRYDLAIVADCLEHLPKREALELVAGIRNLNASRLAVMVDLNACDWLEADFFALAMQASERFERDGQMLTLFTYDLYDYKQIPDWLNAKFWANPQHFGKYWW